MWFVVEFEVEVRHEEMAGWLMMQLGANGCEVSPSEDPNVLLKATFEGLNAGPPDLVQINAALDEYGLSKSIATLRVKPLEEEDWLSKWKAGFEPFALGDSFLVCPPWAQDTLDEQLAASRQLILIEPGLAFGTGFHATTQFCLLCLETFPGKARVLDVGTGSGILAIGYALLNPDSEIIALETDPVACRVASENFELNKVSHRIKLIEGSTQGLLQAPAAGKFDLILSNLTCEDIAALLPDYMELTGSGGSLIFAGVLTEKLPQLKRALSDYPLLITREESGTMWTGLVVSKP